MIYGLPPTVAQPAQCRSDIDEASILTQTLLADHSIPALGQLAADKQVPGMASDDGWDQYERMFGQQGVCKLLLAR